MRTLNEEPNIDPTASTFETRLGRYTALGPRSSMIESSMGDYSYAVNDVQIAYTEIGKFCSIAAQCRINPGNHPMWRAAMHHFSYRSVAYGLAEVDDEEFFNWRRDHQVTLGHDVWLGHGVTIMPGVKLGTGSVVGSGAVVTKDVPDFAIFVGVPAKLMRFRFNESIQDGLKQIAWWDWDHATLREHMSEFRNFNAEEFVERFRDRP